MAKLTKKQRSELRRILLAAEASHAYLHRPELAITIRKPKRTTTIDYTRPAVPALDGSTEQETLVLYEVAKYGSDLVQLETAIANLAAFLVHN